MVSKITPISKPTRLTKDNLTDMLNSAVDEINEIRDLYEKFFASIDGKSSYLDEIESRLSAITAEYVDLFDGPSLNKVEEAKQALDDIKAFHKELLDGSDSIKVDIEDSQTKINAFYSRLFTSSDGGVTKDGGQDAIVEAAIKSITDFDAKLNNTASGYKFSIETAKNEILEAHSELFKKNKATGKSASDQLNDEIVETHKLHDEVKNEIVPFISEQKTEISSVAKDIKSKQIEVDSLLSNATVRALSQGYAQSMQTYGSPIVHKFPKKAEGGKFVYVISFLWNQFRHFLKFTGSYILFIGPLLLIGTLFVVNNTTILGIDLATKSVHFSGAEYILYKLTIALPLLWVSWFGQRSISHRKRLFEEYNHKLRVVQMYMLFTAQKNTYTLSDIAMTKLEEELLTTIARNPSQVYGKDETMIDKLIDIFTKKGNADTQQDIQSDGEK